MEKSKLLFTINETVKACENLATISSKNCENMDCLGLAIDCADAGMMLIMKLSNNSVPRTLLKQYTGICQQIIKKCGTAEGAHALQAVQMCKSSITASATYLEEELHPDHYFLSSLSSMPLMTA
ncbi:hypothetical protein [Fulvivirga ligni]|uniref:hypothetical protein n=1 Tax=Fulvivirga ligni TaxID=2904246 RepID=UPI001F1A6A2B|nr:hypothetical protein [Fulvivirga ligni]UII19947.1 hypothetical protein LVD16_19065 [Fulvivirga ligni]